ncbi:unnamed protein product, partial [Didymodactylos carnosus]
KTIETSINDLTTGEAEFIWFQLLLETLFRIPQSETAKNDMVNECRKFCKNDQIELRNLRKLMIQPMLYAGPKNITLYRGQRIKIDEMIKLESNIGQLISMNTFQSVSRSCEVAAQFAGGDDPSCLVNEAQVIFEMNIDTSACHSKPFADISHLSFMKSEDEILMSVATVLN